LEREKFSQKKSLGRGTGEGRKDGERGAEKGRKGGVFYKISKKKRFFLWVWKKWRILAGQKRPLNHDQL
jgi:hypothetical protein